MSNTCVHCSKKLSLAAAISTAKCACSQLVCPKCRGNHIVQCEAVRDAMVASKQEFCAKLTQSATTAQKLAKV